jgi:serine/threonine protein kinase
MLSPEKDSLLGTRIREYEILDIIGRGGMGAVYKARHVYLDEERAIKLIRTGLSEKTAFVNRFIREAKLLTKLRHPNLVQLYEFGTLEQENTFFMVLELVKGESVLERINRNGKIPVNEAISIVRQAALGLELAHQKGVIHRDISPDNLLIVTDEENKEMVKVIDFGIAKPTVEETHRYTIENMFLGKLEYSSPEQCGFHEQGEVIDHRSDIYSLAVTLYHMLSGKLPFYSPTPQGYMIKHASEAPKPVSSLLPEGYLPPGLDELILRALSKQRDDRQSSMRELIQELDAITSPEVPAAPKQTVSTDLKPGDLFAKRYKILEKIGQGGMGIVFRATDTMLGVTVALKVMSAALSDNPKALDRFKREVILARRVAHRNVCRIYDFGEYEGVHYVSMELLEGRTLADILRREGPYTAETGIPILTQILYALQEAHSAGIVHRDLKPQNIIVDAKGRATITDFGISTSSGVTRLTQTGALIGTPRYMAPEQFGERTVDHRTDIYSIAIIMFEMFTGALPYEANTPASMMYAHLNSLPHKPSDLAPDIPPQLEQIILKGLEKDPNNRYQDVDGLLQDLQPFIKTARRDSNDMTWTKRGDMTFDAANRNVGETVVTSEPTLPPEFTAPPSPPKTPAEIKPPAMKEQPKPEAVNPEPVKTEQPGPKAFKTLDASSPGTSGSKPLPLIPIIAGAGALLLLVFGFWFFSKGKGTQERTNEPAAASTAQAPVK